MIVFHCSLFMVLPQMLRPSGSWIIATGEKKTRSWAVGGERVEAMRLTVETSEKLQ